MFNNGDAILQPAWSRNNVPVIIASSNYYAPYTGVFVQSLIDHASPEYSYDVIIMECEISEEIKRILTSMVEPQKNISIRFFNPNQILPVFNGGTLFPREVYWRIFTPYLFKNNKKIITIGVDTILKEDIASLLALDLGDACVGAVRDVYMTASYGENVMMRPSEMRAREYIDRVLNLKNPSNYVNADVVIYDTRKFINICNFSVMCDQTKKNYLYADQDILNLLMEREIMHIPMKWNFMVPLSFQEKHFLSLLDGELKDAYQQASLSPAILHWAGRPKPWVCPDVPYGNEWWDVAKRTPFMSHILARMIDELQTRKVHYKNKYGQDVPAWDPVPAVDRSKKKQ